MSDYFSTDEKVLENPTAQEVSEMYNQGYVLTRLGKWYMNQTRSLRINLEKFETNSENRRILRKNEDVRLAVRSLPLDDYSWEIHKFGKDFYSKRFGEGTMSASKIKEMFTDMERSNMNMVFEYRKKMDKRQKAIDNEEGKGKTRENKEGKFLNSKFEVPKRGKKTASRLPLNGVREEDLVRKDDFSTPHPTSGHLLPEGKEDSHAEKIDYMAEEGITPLSSPLKGSNLADGYCLGYVNEEIVHYAYPFYDLDFPRSQNLGMGMMVKAIVWAKENGKRFVYLGSVTTPESKYKLQFEGLEWFDTDEEVWKEDLEELKGLIVE